MFGWFGTSEEISPWVIGVCRYLNRLSDRLLCQSSVRPSVCPSAFVFLFLSRRLFSCPSIHSSVCWPVCCLLVHSLWVKEIYLLRSERTLPPNSLMIHIWLDYFITVPLVSILITLYSQTWKIVSGEMDQFLLPENFSTGTVFFSVCRLCGNSGSRLVVNL